MDTSLPSYHPTLLPSKKRVAFTLAEVLITLAIIGVVAAITLPALITNIQDRVKEKRVQNIQQKFSKATDKMLATSGLNGYDSTLDFVNELKNHLSIAKICENDELRNCWPTEKVIIDDNGKEFEIAKATKGKSLKMTDVDGTSKWDDTVGIITGDGTSMILSYNLLCNIEPTTTSAWSSDKSSSTGCIAAVFDWNGSSKPNKFGKITDNGLPLNADVLTLNANGLGSACVIEVNGNCFGALQPAITSDQYLDLSTDAACNEAKSKWGLKYCRDVMDFYAWAAAQCGGKSNMASLEDLVVIASKIYNNPNMTDADEEYYYLTYNGAIATSLGFPSEPNFEVWSSHETGRLKADYWYFKSTYSGSSGMSGYRAISGKRFLCKLE